MISKLRNLFKVNLLVTSILIGTIVAPITSFAQDGDDELLGNSVRDLSIVGGSMAGGAILGLSTLSFVDEPADHLANVIVGGSIGIIVGVVVVAMRQANTSKDYYFENANLGDFSTGDRVAWHNTWHKNYKSATPASFQYGFSF